MWFPIFYSYKYFITDRKFRGRPNSADHENMNVKKFTLELVKD